MGASLEFLGATAARARPWMHAGQLLGTAAACFGAAKASLVLAIPPGYASAISPSAGIALAILLLAGPKLWPGVWVGAALAYVSAGLPVLAAAVVASGAALQAVCGSAVLRRQIGVPYRFVRADHVVRFVALAAVTATIAPTVGLGVLYLQHDLAGRDLFLNWWTWWQGETSGILLVVPLILSWAARGTVAWTRRKGLEALLFAGLLLAAAHVVFSSGRGDAIVYPTTFVIVPFIVWGAFRFGQREVSTAIAALSAIALWHTLRGETGPFATPALNEALLLLLAFTSTLVVTGLVLCAVLGQLERAMAELRARQLELESRVRMRTRDLEEANGRLQADIDARSRAERRLQESEQRFRLMVESVVDYAILMLGPDGRVTSWNAGAERIKGYRADEAIGQPHARFYPPEEVAQGKPGQHLERAAADGRLEAEGWRVRKDGSMFWGSVVVTAVRDDTGALLGFAEVVRDLTERNRVEADLIRARVAAERASEAKSQFLANMSHELRTPLNSLLILARLLSDNAGGNLNDKQVRFAQTIYASGMDLLSLINDLLDLAKIESGAIVTLDLSPAPLAEVCEDMERTFRQVAQDRRLEFDISLDPAAPPTVRTDAGRLRQVLKNLLSNAFKFTKQGRVSLRIGPAGGGWSEGHPRLSAARAVVAFAVQDTGIGIPPAKQRVIFEAFQQGDGTTSRHYGGTGLGLSISRELTRLLGGEIRVSSRPGEGSTFTLYLPVDGDPRGA